MATKTKTRKTSSKTAKGISKRDYGPLRKHLLKMKEDLRKIVQRTQDIKSVGQDTGDEADQATQSLEKELMFELSDNERTMLDNIEAALRKMDKGTYGICESCRKPIPKKRVQALPFARYCIECQSIVESSIQ
ncbi:MAG: TraR/DksA family transcriptional regulator [Elusimicrobia bacterium]|nr:TraR/DksA family transcriptional regulator [Elusimicrobiota bacterium]